MSKKNTKQKPTGVTISIPDPFGRGAPIIMRNVRRPKRAVRNATLVHMRNMRHEQETSHSVREPGKGLRMRCTNWFREPKIVANSLTRILLRNHA